MDPLMIDPEGKHITFDLSVIDKYRNEIPETLRMDSVITERRRLLLQRYDDMMFRFLEKEGFNIHLLRHRDPTEMQSATQWCFDNGIRLDLTDPDNPQITKRPVLDEPVEWDVHVCRTAYGHLHTKVMARSEHEAHRLAFQKAEDVVFSESDAEYTIEGCVSSVPYGRGTFTEEDFASDTGE
jgi:hypothetical protein